MNTKINSKMEDKKKEICHVCKREKKPYIVILDSNVFSYVHYEQAREHGPICKRCDKYFGMTGEFKDATVEEFEIAKSSAWFAMMVNRFWEKDKPLEDNENFREWEGTRNISKWCREELSKGGSL